jgi:hypothetical protein
MVLGGWKFAHTVGWHLRRQEAASRRDLGDALGCDDSGGDLPLLLTMPHAAH